MRNLAAAYNLSVPTSNNCQRRSNGPFARAESWLAAADNVDADSTWKEAAEQFKSAASAQTWREMLTAARAPLGPLTSRQLAVEQHLNGIPGAPPGEYLVQQYHALYDGRQAVVETLTLIREADGEWRVAGYYIR